MDRDDGGPAFPEIGTDEAYTDEHKLYPRTYSRGGMTLRDYFAAQTIIGLSVIWLPGREGEHDDKLAKRAYEVADALLKARAM